MNIVFLGDSVTQGCFEILKNPSGEWELIIEPEYSYVALIDGKLREKFPDKDINVINAGISGDSTNDALNRLDRDVISGNPDIAVVCLGLNNSGRKNIPEFCSHLTEIFGRLKAAGSEVIFMSPNMLNSYLADGTPDFLINMAKDCAEIQTGGEMDRLMESGMETARSCGATVCDVYSEWKKLDRYGVDTTALLCNHINHPKREMHNLFADMLMPILEEKLKKSCKGTDCND